METLKIIIENEPHTFAVLKLSKSLEFHQAALEFYANSRQYLLVLGTLERQQYSSQFPKVCDLAVAAIC